MIPKKKMKQQKTREIAKATKKFSSFVARKEHEKLY